MKEHFEVSIMMKTKIFEGFTKEECMSLHRKFPIDVRHFDKGEIIFGEGDTVKNICILHRGKLIGIKFYYEGDTHLLTTFDPGETIALEAVYSSFKTSPLTFVADEESEILYFPAAAVDDRSENRIGERLMHNMLKILADDNIKLIYKTEILSKRSLRERVMAYLSIIQKKKGSNSFRIMMSQEQFAQYLCVNRSALSYELNQMKRERVIDFSKDCYEILQK